jgi:ribosome-associated protein
MDEWLDLGSGGCIPVDLVEIRASRSSGPGGQHANVTASRIEASIEISALDSLSDAQRALLLERLGPRVSAIAQDTRSQLRNRELALERLRAKLADALVVDPPRRRTRPKRAAVEKRLQEKRRASERKQARRPPPPE